MKHWTKLGSTCLHRGGGVQFVSPPPPSCRFFDGCILTGRALKLILYDFSSSFILNM